MSVESRKLVGVDVLVESASGAEEVGRRLEVLSEGTAFRLHMISSRGTQVYPPRGTSVDVVDLWQCRFLARSDEGEPTDEDILELLATVGREFRWAKVQNLQIVDGQEGFTKAQG